VAWSQDGRVAFSGSGTKDKDKYSDTILKQWDVENAKEVSVDKSHKTSVLRLALVPEGKTLFSVADTEKQVRRWSVGDKALVPGEPIKSNEGSAFDVVVAIDGQTVATLGVDTTVVVRDLATGKRLREWLIPEYVTGLAYASDCRHLAVTTAVGVVYILRADGPG
jgi:WD40 repeat protein